MSNHLVVLFLASAGRAQLSIIHEANDNTRKAMSSRCSEEREKGEIGDRTGIDEVFRS